MKLLKNEFVILFFLSLIFSFVLMQPQMLNGKPLEFVDALFTSVSALTVTGLIVVPTGTYFSFYGHSFLLLLIQIGGIGVVALGSYFGISLLKKTEKFEQKLTDLNSYSRLAQSWYKIPLVLFFAIKFILITQVIGFVFLKLFGMNTFDALFHSISGFNNAGFSTFDNNLIDYANNLGIILTMTFLIFLGSIGFLVLLDLYNLVINKKKLSIYSKLVLQVTILSIVIGFIFHYLDLKATNHSISSYTAFMIALFHSVSIRTAGFITYLPSAFGNSATFITLLLMFIGGGSISSAGGIKVSTVYVFLRDIASGILNLDFVTARKSRFYIPRVLVRSARLVISFYLITLIISIMLLTFTEHQSNFTLAQLVYESVSALSNVGPSLGVTYLLSDYGKYIIIFNMLIGRVGVFYFIRTGLVALNKKLKNDYAKNLQDLRELDITVG